MNPDPSHEDITEGPYRSAGEPPASFDSPEGSIQRTRGSDDSMILLGISDFPVPDEGQVWLKPDGSAWRYEGGQWVENAPRNPELDRIDDRIRAAQQEVLDWARQNLEEMRQPE